MEFSDQTSCAASYRQTLGVDIGQYDSMTIIERHDSMNMILHDNNDSHDDPSMSR